MRALDEEYKVNDRVFITDFYLSNYPAWGKEGGKECKPKDLGLYRLVFQNTALRMCEHPLPPDLSWPKEIWLFDVKLWLKSNGNIRVNGMTFLDDRETRVYQQWRLVLDSRVEVNDDLSFYGDDDK